MKTRGIKEKRIVRGVGRTIACFKNLQERFKCERAEAKERRAAAFVLGGMIFLDGRERKERERDAAEVRCMKGS